MKKKTSKPPSIAEHQREIARLQKELNKLHNEYGQAQENLLAQMRARAESDVVNGGPHVFWKRKILTWALRQLTPCWLWNKL